MLGISLVMDGTPRADRPRHVRADEARKGSTALVLVPEDALVDAVPQHEVLEAVSWHLDDPAVDSVVVDLSRIPALDLEGVATLVKLKRRGVAAGKRLMVDGLSEPARRKLELTGVFDWLARDAVA